MYFDLINSYNEIDEENRLKSTNARKVEYYTTVRVLERFFFKGIKIFDCGCGVGIYSLKYAKEGADVVALDIVPKHIKRLSEIASSENIQLRSIVGDARNLCQFPNNEYDMTLCLGPLYHLVSDEDHISCIHECIRITKENGIIAFAYISPYSVFPCVIRGDANRISDKLIKKILDDKKILSSDELCFWTDNYYYSPQDIENVLRKFNLEIVDHVATDGQSIAFQSVVNSFDEKAFKLWLDYHWKICRERSILGCSNHGLVIVRKK